eukprot:1599768-Amphidinium_carterae.1
MDKKSAIVAEAMEARGLLAEELTNVYVRLAKLPQKKSLAQGATEGAGGQYRHVWLCQGTSRHGESGTPGQCRKAQLDIFQLDTAEPLDNVGE